MALIALKCEQCGGNIALEEDGTGKCPYCGCKYVDSHPITNNKQNASSFGDAFNIDYI